MKRHIKKDKREWLENIAQEAEAAARSQHIKTLYGFSEVPSDEMPGQRAAVKDKNGIILINSEERI